MQSHLHNHKEIIQNVVTNIACRVFFILNLGQKREALENETQFYQYFTSGKDSECESKPPCPQACASNHIVI